MGEAESAEVLREHAEQTLRLVERARQEGNLALARELERVARAVERRIQEPG